MNDPLLVACPNCCSVNRIPLLRLNQAPNCGRCHKPLFAGHPVKLDAAGFECHVMRSSLPVLIDFWAPWCAPCRRMAPEFEQAAIQLEPRIRLAKIDTESNPELAIRFGIRSIPTLILMKNGRELARQAGMMSSTDIVRWVENNPLPSHDRGYLN